MGKGVVLHKFMADPWTTALLYINMHMGGSTNRICQYHGKRFMSPAPDRVGLTDTCIDLALPEEGAERNESMRGRQ
jgi:hypothetical protein